MKVLKITPSTVRATLLLLGLFVLLAGCSKKKEDATIGVRSSDAEMNAAIQKARATLPQFWQVFEHPEHGETEFCLKVPITEEDETEHFWADQIEKKDGKISGRISNNPERVHKVKFGDRIEIQEGDISDWLYMRDGKIVGNRTMRALFSHMSADEVAKYKSMLADPDGDK